MIKSYFCCELILFFEKNLGFNKLESGLHEET